MSNSFVKIFVGYSRLKQTRFLGNKNRYLRKELVPETEQCVDARIEQLFMVWDLGLDMLNVLQNEISEENDHLFGLDCAHLHVLENEPQTRDHQRLGPELCPPSISREYSKSAIICRISDKNNL